MSPPRNINFFANETTFDFQGNKIQVQNVPHTCPHCHREVGMTLTGIINGPIENGVQVLLLGFQCPSCHELTIGRYYAGAGSLTPTYAFSNKPYVYPEPEFRGTIFSEEIYDKFLRFTLVYNQSEKAEHYDCKDIAGAGYRKAAEILVRDFACLIYPEKKESILNTSNAKNVVFNFLKEYTLMCQLAEASFELGNDEAHYKKTYQDKGLKDLKEFIKATVAQIEAILHLRELNRVRAEKDK